jgi:hypothetical protein
VTLKPNDIYGPITLEKRAIQGQPGSLDPDIALLSSVVQAIDFTFNYQFDCTVPIRSLYEEVQVEMTMEEPGRWKKTTVLLPPTTRQEGKVSFFFTLDPEEIRAIGERLGLGSGREQDVVITAQVHTIARTDAGPVDEVFKKELNGKLTKEKLELEGAPASVQKGTITQEVKESNLIARQMRFFSPIGLGAGFLALCGLGFLYRRGRPQLPLPEREYGQARKRHKELLVEVEDLPSVRGGESVVNLTSLEELIKTAENLASPVHHTADSGNHTYVVLAGLMRYQYVSANPHNEVSRGSGKPPDS